MALLFSFSVLFLTITKSSSLKCYSDNFCECESGSDCLIKCPNPTNSLTICNWKTFICPENQHCEFECINKTACIGTIINAHYAKSLTIVTTNKTINNTEQLQGISVNCPYNGQCNINCNYQFDCKSIKIQAQYSKSLIITTKNDGTIAHDKLFGSQIFCPYNGTCIINCNAVEDCANNIIYASKSNNLTINALSMYSLRNNKIICPNTNKDSNSCTINGFDNNAIYRNQIYADSGFYDVTFNCINETQCLSGDYNKIYCNESM